MKTKEIKALQDKYHLIIDELVMSINKSDCEIDIAGDSVDKIQGSSLASIHNTILRKNIVRLELLKAAVERIEDGTFDGACEECGEDIGIKRLEVLPGAVMCIKCAEQAEYYQRNSV